MPATLKIALISKSGPGGGGAGRVANALARGLRARGHRVDRLVAWPPRLHPDGETYRPLRGPISARLSRWARALGLQELVPLELPRLLAQAGAYDLLHFHDLSLSVSPVSVALLSRIMPVVWTFHDSSPFTGGCVHPLDCPRLERGCGRCPQRGNWPLDGFFDATRPARAVKTLAARLGRFTVLTPSRWMAEQAARAGLRLPAQTAPNPVDPQTFFPARRPEDRDGAKQALDLPRDRPLLSFAAGSLADPWKGTDQAARLLRELSRITTGPKPTLCLAGHADRAVTDLFRDLDVRFLGQVAEPARMALLYRAADLHLCCSSAESFCLTVAEAMACATPVAAFRAGALPEAVEHGRTGLLAEPGDAPGLAREIAEALTRGRLEAMGRAAGQFASARCSPEVFVATHERVYAEAIAARKPRRAAREARDEPGASMLGGRR